jgi:hypothetical protein
MDAERLARAGIEAGGYPTSALEARDRLEFEHFCSD